MSGGFCPARRGKTKRASLRCLYAVLLAAILTPILPALACTSLYVGAHCTQEGTAFVARTEDSEAEMNKLWFIAEAGRFRVGETYVGCPRYGGFEWVFTHDSYRFTYFTNDAGSGVCPICGCLNPTHLSFTESGTNEKGVSVSATETIYGNWAVKAVDPCVTEKRGGRVGIQETDIPTILLAEAASAREGVELLARIFDTCGAYDEAGLFICDQREIWYVEICSGTQYIALKLNDDLIFLEPNLSVIGRIDLDDTANVLSSPRLIQVAQQAQTFVGDAEQNIIDYRASYANTGTPEYPRVGHPRLADGLNYLNPGLKITDEALAADNTLFTLSNVKDGAIVPLYTNIQADRILTRNDVFGFYQLPSVGKPINQEIEIFQFFAGAPLESGTASWVALGDMSYNVFVPYYPLLLTDIYPGYQVSAPSVSWIPMAAGRPDTLCTALFTGVPGETYYVLYPRNWRDSMYFTFEGLSGYIRCAQAVDGRPVSDADKRFVRDRLDALQREFIAEFDALDPRDTTAVGMSMARRAHEAALSLIDRLMAR